MQKRKKSSRENTFREPTLPSDLTDQLRERLMSLPSSVKADYLKEQMFSKYLSDDKYPPLYRRNQAIFKWLCIERNNEATNDRLRITHAEYNILPRVSYGRFVQVCRDIIVDIIGAAPPVEAFIGSFSGGASTSRGRTVSHPANKYFGEAHVTLEAAEIFQHFVVPEVPGWLTDDTASSLRAKVVSGNVLFTVPKETDIDRCACKEPDLNMFIQKGVGSFFRKRLRRKVNINLNDQSINRSLARRGSIDGSLATLDLSSASDSVSTGLVTLLLPEMWTSLLGAIRSPVTVINGEEHLNHMFSSMGNGFTFELESLLFYALMRTTAYFRGSRGVISVYGDDLIIPTELASYSEFVLNFFGFQVNSKKSFSSGPFRESCGGHYYDGFDITPFYVKEPIKRVVDIIEVANKLRQWGTITCGDSRNLFAVVSPDVEAIWLWLKGFIPSYLWGGADTAYKYQLVSKDKPVKRLSEETDRRGTGVGGYVHWLNSTWARTQLNDPVRTSKRTVSLGKLNLKGVRDTTVPLLEAMFVHELG